MDARTKIAKALRWLASKIQGRDHEWMALARGGAKVAAIKRHREIHESSLKQALDAVNAYIDGGSLQ